MHSHAAQLFKLPIYKPMTLELELVQAYMAQKPMLQVEVDALV